LEQVLVLVKAGCTHLPDFGTTASFFFRYPEDDRYRSILPKWNEAKQLFFIELIRQLELDAQWQGFGSGKRIQGDGGCSPDNREIFCTVAIMLVGGKYTGSI